MDSGNVNPRSYQAWQQQQQPPQLYNVTTDSGHTDATIEQTRDAMILMANTYIGEEDEVDGIATVIDSGATDHCFADFLAFTEYKKFDAPLTGRTAEKGISFTITGQGTVKMAIEVKNERVVDLTLQNVLHTPELHSNLILIPKVCGLGLDVQFGEKEVVAKFSDGHTAIHGIQRNGLYLVKVLHKPIVMHTRSIVRATSLDDWH